MRKSIFQRSRKMNKNGLEKQKPLFLEITLKVPLSNFLPQPKRKTDKSIKKVYVNFHKLPNLLYKLVSRAIF